MSIQNIEQQRAKFALEKVKSIPNSDHKEWKSRANEIPAMIQMNGLGQTMAFYLSKGGIHQQMYALVQEWLCSHMHVFGEEHTSDPDLMYAITTHDVNRYRLAQAEAQALLIWVKKFSKAYCKEEAQ